LAALLVAVWAASLTEGPLLWASCGLGWTLLALAAADFKYFLLPDFLTLPLILAGLAVAAFFTPEVLHMHALGAIAGWALVVAIRFAYRKIRHREGMGLGDAKLLAAAGAWVSLEGIPSVMLIGAFSGLLFAIVTAVRKGGLSLTDRIPFGVFLALGTWIVWLYGPVVTG
jgi:leader peptidase (prepilin peptidase)/N-methyltransferase